MIRLYLSGGLGNQLFEYATARAVALRNDVPLQIDLRFYAVGTAGTSKGAWLEDLSVQATFKRYETALVSPHNPLRRGIEKLLVEPFGEVHIDKDLGFNEQVMRLGRNAILIGFFQCYRYFELHWPTISRELDVSRFADCVWLAADARERIPWCAVHIRRGDYVGDPRFEMQSTERYYRHAMDLVREAEPLTEFVVFSDDVDWCRTQSWLGGCDFYTGTPGHHAAVDLATMSEATSNIISNSSYSWWAAWLGRRPGKLVVAPSIWVDGRRTDELEMVPGEWRIV
jgi:hypothetical protein